MLERGAPLRAAKSAAIVFVYTGPRTTRETNAIRSGAGLSGRRLEDTTQHGGICRWKAVAFKLDVGHVMFGHPRLGRTARLGGAVQERTQRSQNYYRRKQATAWTHAIRRYSVRRLNQRAHARNTPPARQ
eukprot:1378029-Prymnesium_polylepis.1